MNEDQRWLEFDPGERVADLAQLSLDEDTDPDLAAESLDPYGGAGWWPSEADEIGGWAEDVAETGWGRG